MIANAVFPLGRVVMTSGVHAIVQGGNLNPATYLRRHATGDWGDLCADDKQLNDQSVKGDGRLFSSYEVNEQLKLWIITEWDRSVTTLLLPSEY